MKSYVIVGGSSGIGLGIVHRLVDLGGRVTVISRSRGDLPQASAIEHISADVCTDEFTDQMLPDVVDGLVYCPGSIHLGAIRSIQSEELIEDFNLNVVGAVKVIQASLTALKKSENASVVAFSSVAVGQGMPMHASVAATKGAVEGLTRSLAAELAPHVRVNCIAPSLTDTPLSAKFLSSEAKRSAMVNRHPLKRVGTVDDIAAAVGFLLSDESGWMTGQVIAVDGGLSSLRA